MASSALTILSAATLPSCASADSNVTFVWTVMTGSAQIPSAIKSSSLDPSQFYLAPYKLTADTTYTINVAVYSGTKSVSATTTVYVRQDVVIAAVVGGYMRSAPVDKSLLLDASISFDSNLSPSIFSNLSYQVM